MAKKKESTLINMLLALFVITAVSGGLLGLVYGFTKDKIAEVEAQKNAKAIAEVLPLEGEVTYKADTLKTEDGIFPCNLAFDAAGNFKGAAIKTSEGGFGGKIEMMVGFLADGTIKGTSVLSHSETPGLGANMTGPFTLFSVILTLVSSRRKSAFLFALIRCTRSLWTMRFSTNTAKLAVR